MAATRPPLSGEDYDFLTFTLVGSGKTITFPTLITQTQIRFGSTWDEFSEIGRADSKVMLSKVDKSIDLDFLVVATGYDGGVAYTHQKLEELSKVTAPRYANGFEGFQGEFVQLSFGGLYNKEYFYIESLNYSIDNETTTWDIGRGTGREALPILTKVNILLKFVGRSMPSSDKNYFEDPPAPFVPGNGSAADQEANNKRKRKRARFNLGGSVNIPEFQIGKLNFGGGKVNGNVRF